MRKDDGDYLWDRSGAPDPEVARLEELLGGERYQGAPGRLPRRPRTFRFLAAGLATAALAAATLAFVLSRPARAPGPHAGATPDAPPDGPAWSVAALAGAPRCGAAPCTALRPGQWLETGHDERAEVAVADIGHLRVEPGSRLRLVESGPEQHRLELAVGSLHASVVAPPRLLVVDTPAATAVDLGCAYTLTVEADGATRLEVTSGWVALEAPGRVAAYVPAGATARSVPGAGPTTPLFTDAPDALVAAAARLDAAPDDAAALAAALAAARTRDTLTLWHLLQRVPAGLPRASVLSRMLDLGPTPPPGVSTEALLALEPAALEAYRGSLIRLW